MRILGAGAVGSTLGRAWANSGHQVTFATRNPDDPLSIGPNASAVAVQRVVEHGEVVVPATRPLLGIGCEPRFAIGQRALLVPARAGDGPGGKVLWDCISLIDDAAVRVVEALGGISAIAISHPHYYSSMVEWSRAFDGAPIYLHSDERSWVMRPDPAIVFWEGDELEIGRGLTLLRLGGHFAGAQVLHWAAGADGRAVVLAGDILQVVQDRRFVLAPR
jgi:hypothetical protein